MSLNVNSLNSLPKRRKSLSKRRKRGSLVEYKLKTSLMDLNLLPLKRRKRRKITSDGADRIVRLLTYRPSLPR